MGFAVVVLAASCEENGRPLFAVNGQPGVLFEDLRGPVGAVDLQLAVLAFAEFIAFSVEGFHFLIQEFNLDCHNRVSSVYFDHLFELIVNQFPRNQRQTRATTRHAGENAGLRQGCGL